MQALTLYSLDWLQLSNLETLTPHKLGMYILSRHMTWNVLYPCVYISEYSHWIYIWYWPEFPFWGSLSLSLSGDSTMLYYVDTIFNITNKFILFICTVFLSTGSVCWLRSSWGIHISSWSIRTVCKGRIVHECVTSRGGPLIESWLVIVVWVS